MRDTKRRRVGEDGTSAAAGSEESDDDAPLVGARKGAAAPVAVAEQAVAQPPTAASEAAPSSPVASSGSDSDSDSEDKQPDEPASEAAGAGSAGGAAPKEQAAEPSSDSSDSDDSSSDSSSSSDDESEAERAADGEREADGPVERDAGGSEDEGQRKKVKPKEKEQPPMTAEEKARAAEEARKERIEGIRHSYLSRDELVRMLVTLPEKIARQAIENAFVRVKVIRQGQPEAHIVAHVQSIEPSPRYVVQLSENERRTLSVQLQCKRGPSSKLVKLIGLSNEDMTEEEISHFLEITLETLRGNDKVLESLFTQKVKDLHLARNFKFEDEVVEDMMKKKGKPEFDAKKESRMRFELQCVLSRMHISGIRDFEADELEKDYQSALQGLQKAEAKSAALQEQWFESRPNLFSLKEINRRNRQRQVENDRHALEYTLANEASGTQALNPFERRACRPVCAWDTKLTFEGPGTPGPGGGTPAGPGTPAPRTPAGIPRTPAGQAEEPSSRALTPLSAMLRAHRRLDLSRVGSLLAAPPRVMAN